MDSRTYRIIGIAMRVQRKLGRGFRERTYQDALALEFRRQGIPFRREVEMIVTYDGTMVGGRCRVDFVCYEDIMVEIKAQPCLTSAHVGQLGHYLAAAGFPMGLLLNFGSPSLGFYRVTAFRGPASGS